MINYLGNKLFYVLLINCD